VIIGAGSLGLVGSLEPMIYAADFTNLASAGWKVAASA
jgi:hypothetical protein